MKEIIGAITVALTFVGILPYIFDIFRNKTKPHLFTWLVWAIVTIIAFIIQWQKGGGAGSWTTLTAGILTIFIAIISFKKGSADITKSDVVIFIAALLSIIPWLIIKDPTLSAVLITFIDALGFLPTIRKTANDPGSETFSSYVIHAVRHSLSIVALANYNLATYIYPTTLATMNIVVIITILKFHKK